ncbi:glycosyltransferase [Roseovarius sp. M141]|uniref:glycosyltransferase n=1 Tax=Roseovarius sp. M141 TaxID=2583806 RepID=UPI0020CD97C8|nr:glycosyltransferase [Roseovarius sp. M141]MCQ0090533.1 glycosyltransferase [Roseovarius sp. M141]
MDGIRYAPGVSAEIFALYADELDGARTRAQSLPVFNIPSDYTSNPDSRLRRPFRRVRPDRKVPSPYPKSLALPGLVGMRNDWAFLRDVATAYADLPQPAPSVHVIAAVGGDTDIAALGAALAGQDFDGPVRLSVFDPAPDSTLSLPPALSPEVIAGDILGPEANAYLRLMIDRDTGPDDLVLFLSGEVTLDRSFLKRAAFLARTSRNVVQPLVPLVPAGAMQTLYSWNDRHKLSGARYPFRDVEGMNFVMSMALLRRIGLPDMRFSNTHLAAREMAWRMFNLGAYFAPLSVPALVGRSDAEPTHRDKSLYVALCPNHWDRKKDAQFERPRASIYIPAYNAGKYIRRAVDSVLEQDVRDLEVCIADDGSTDDTLALLQRHYGSNPQVRVQTALNGGIGHASNRAIRMAQAPYIGQLDSDDCLKPGAVRALMTYLDDHPEVACAYGSCERIDAEGNYVKNEYSWPVFSREKMMVTSIAHHFRMFRRSCWERTTYFREDIVNAVDYDIFLKLAETGPFHHIDRVFYQRRWHGENTSSVNEGFQTTNTHIVQNETLSRLGLDRFWKVHVPDPKEPRRVTYTRTDDCKTVLFWPDYSRANPYQHMLYSKARSAIEFCAGNIDAALEQIDTFKTPGDLTFHLHWINFVLVDATGPEDARAKVEAFLTKIEKFVSKGGRLVWTIHNSLSHDTSFGDLEVEMSTRIAAAAHVLHFHSEASVDEVARTFEVPRDKVQISRHGHYLGAYPDFIDRDCARAQLDLDPQDHVIVFSGQVRRYKGVAQLITVFREILKDRPQAVLLIVGESKVDIFEGMTPALTEWERSRIRMTNRFVDDMEMQVFMRAADMAVYPYRNILTSGSMLLALSFALPVAIPAVGMTRDVLEGQNAGVCYDAQGGPAALKQALDDLLSAKDSGTLPSMAANARRVAQEQDWPDFSVVFS